jgi:hypothetical protein
MPSRTLFEKIWAQHVVAELSGEQSLLSIDRHFLHDLEGGPNFTRLAKLGYRVHDPELTFAMPDHAISSLPGRTTDTNPTGGRLLRELRRTYAAMSPAQQKVIDNHCNGEWGEKVAAPWADFERDGIAKLKAEPDHEVYSLTDEQLDRRKSAAGPVVQAWSANVKGWRRSRRRAEGSLGRSRQVQFRLLIAKPGSATRGGKACASEFPRILAWRNARRLPLRTICRRSGVRGIAEAKRRPAEFCQR